MNGFLDMIQGNIALLLFFEVEENINVFDHCRDSKTLYGLLFIGPTLISTVIEFFFDYGLGDGR